MAAEQLVYDYRDMNLTPADTALCDYAVKLTLTPAAACQADIDRLRSNGFSDAAITIAVQVISYFNGINRIAEGLGVALEPWMTIPPKEWRSLKADYREIAS